MKLYKLTTVDDLTRPGEANETLWGEGVTHTASGEGELCGPGFIHAYEDPRVAVLLNPIHAAYDSFHLWECEGKIALVDGQLKCGCTSLTTIRTIEPPTLTTEQRVEIAIRCAMTVHQNRAWLKWANAWLDGSDRSAAAAYAAYAAFQAAWAATPAAWAATDAAWAARAARAARAANAARACAAAAWAATPAAWAKAAHAATDAAAVIAYDAVTQLDLISIINEVIKCGKIV